MLVPAVPRAVLLLLGQVTHLALSADCCSSACRTM